MLKLLREEKCRNKPILWRPTQSGCLASKEEEGLGLGVVTSALASSVGFSGLQLGKA